MMLNHEMFARIVNKINAQYGTEYYLPAEYLWQDHEWIIKAFGTVVWSSENSTASSESTICDLVYQYVNKYVLVRIWKEQMDCVKSELLWKLEDEGVAEGHVVSVEDYFENELEMLKTL